MPAEWEPHAATWLTWPRPDGITFPGRYEVVPPVLAKLVRLIAEGEAVHINIWDAELERVAKHTLEAEGVPMAAVEFPTASRLSVRSRTSLGNSLISAMPPALSAIGP